MAARPFCERLHEISARVTDWLIWHLDAESSIYCCFPNWSLRAENVTCIVFPPTDCPGHHPVSADGSGRTAQSPGGGTHTQWVSRTVSLSVFACHSLCYFLIYFLRLLWWFQLCLLVYLWTCMWMCYCNWNEKQFIVLILHTSAPSIEKRPVIFCFVILESVKVSSCHVCPSFLLVLCLLPLCCSLSSPVIPSLSQARELFVPALSVALVGFSFHSAVGSVLARKHGYHLDFGQVQSLQFELMFQWRLSLCDTVCLFN